MSQITLTARLAAAMFVTAALSGPAGAQSVTTAFEGFSGRSDEPVRIEADNLEVREKDEAAIFTGNVVVVQGESTLRSNKLTIFYVGEATNQKNQLQGETKGGDAAVPTGRDIRRLEAEGNVIVTSNDQRAVGASGVFDMASNTVTLTGGVTVSQGGNILKGSRLLVDLNTQRSRIESGGGSGRVQGLFVPGAARGDKNQ
jgi:lipopolysaccharide export system protein LptA